MPRLDEHWRRQTADAWKADSSALDARVRCGGEVERSWSRRWLDIEVAADEFKRVDHTQGTVGELELGYLLV